jgi:hypothetical protein
VLGPAGVVPQIRGALDPLAGGVADDDGEITLEATVPAPSTAFVRAEIRRPTSEVTSPVDEAPVATMVALTNAVFV